MRTPCFAAAIGLIGLALPDPARAQTKESRSFGAVPRVAVEGSAAQSGLAYRATIERTRPLSGLAAAGVDAKGRIDRRLTAMIIDEFGALSVKQLRAGAELAGTPANGERLDLSIGLNF